jgi:hypothetical protein
MAEFHERIAKLSPKRVALLAADLQAKDVLEAGGAGCPEPRARAADLPLLFHA